MLLGRARWSSGFLAAGLLTPILHLQWVLGRADLKQLEFSREESQLSGQADRGDKYTRLARENVYKLDKFGRLIQIRLTVLHAPFCPGLLHPRTALAKHFLC